MLEHWEKLKEAYGVSVDTMFIILALFTVGLVIVRWLKNIHRELVTIQHQLEFLKDGVKHAYSVQELDLMKKPPEQKEKKQ